MVGNKRFVSAQSLCRPEVWCDLAAILALIYCTEPHLKIAEVLQHFSERAIEHSIERVQYVFSITFWFPSGILIHFPFKLFFFFFGLRILL